MLLLLQRAIGKRIGQELAHLTMLRWITLTDDRVSLVCEVAAIIERAFYENLVVFAWSVDIPP